MVFNFYPLFAVLSKFICELFKLKISIIINCTADIIIEFYENMEASHLFYKYLLIVAL